MDEIYIFKSPIGHYRAVIRGGALVRLSPTREAISPPQSAAAAELERQVAEYFAGRRRGFEVEVNVGHCTEFQQAVLGELTRIPYGETRSYGEIAAAIGRKGAARAIGGACNRNPIHLIIPCHRVVGADRKLVGYAAGISVKEQLLMLEGGE